MILKKQTMKIRTFLMLTVLFMSIISCEDFLEENPKDFLSPDNLPVTVEDCDLMLNGAIGHMRNQDYYDRYLVFLAGISADDMDVRYT